MSTPPNAAPSAWAATPQALRGWCVLLAALMLAVCVLAFDPLPPPQLDTGWDKLNHLLAFFTLTVNTALAGQRWRQRLAVSALAMLGFGAFIELVQSQVPGRAGEWRDLLADAAGIGLALLATRPLDRLLRLR